MTASLIVQIKLSIVIDFVTKLMLWSFLVWVQNCKIDQLFCNCVQLFFFNCVFFPMWPIYFAIVPIFCNCAHFLLEFCPIFFAILTIFLQFAQFCLQLCTFFLAIVPNSRPTTQLKDCITCYTDYTILHNSQSLEGEITQSYFWFKHFTQSYQLAVWHSFICDGVISSGNQRSKEEERKIHQV